MKQRYYTIFYKADEAASAFQAKYREELDEDSKRTRRIRNAAAIADRLEDKDYTLEEVRRIVVNIAGL